jgi:hypothetical protein
MHLASLGLSPSKFIFLYSYFAQHPDRWTAQHWDLLKAAHGITLNRGVGEDSPEYFSAMQGLLNQHAAPAPPPPMPPPVHEPEPEPQHVEHDPEPESEPMASYVSAPVSRGEAGHAVEPEMSANSIRLSKAEIEHAQAAGVSVEEYGRQKLRMMKMKKANVIKD